MAGKVLVVDDDASVQRLLQFTLQQEGYEVIVASDGADGCAAGSRSRPTLILLDVTVRQIDGYEVATRIRAEEGRAATSRSSCSRPTATCRARSARSGPAPTTT